MKKVTEMKKWMVSLLTVAVMFGLAANASAGLIGTGTHYNLEMSDPISVGDGSENLLAVIFTAWKANSLEAGPNTFDGTSQGRYGIGQDADLHHEQMGNGAGGITLTTPDLTLGSLSPIDSHVLVLPADVGGTPTEVMIDPATSSESPAGVPMGETGFGSPLSGAFGVNGGNPNEHWDFAYIVVKSGTFLDYNFRISGGGVGDNFEGGVMIPEPATLTLLCIGGTAVIFRRRSNRRKRTV